MSRTGQKRANGTEIPKSSQKRRKLQGPLKQRIETKPSAAFSANELSWREVTPPERLDDAEGFLGLEEIDDVEVIRDAQGKQTRFRVRCICSGSQRKC